MKNNLPAAILEKYFKGECNEIEIAEIYSWYDSFDSLSDDISHLSENEQELFKQLMLNNILDDIGYAEKDKVHSLNKIKQNRAKIIYWATSIAAMLLIGLFINYKTNNSFNVPTTPKPQPALTNKIVVTNMTNTIKKIVLSDGSKVWLSPNSKLTYLKLFAAHSRRVSMTGEAFFEVTKDAKRPFSIYSDNVVTKVWGTSFRIRAYKNELTKVSVVTGKVSVSVLAQVKSTADFENVKADVKQQLMLTPDQEAIYNKKSNSLQKKQEITDPSISIWKNTSISFDNTPMPEVFRILSKQFKVTISSTDSKINSDYLNADFTDESLPSIMEIIKKSLNVTYKVKDNQFILESN
ncbi:MAG: FecR family protein [Mucilaginibacter sp.]